MFKKFGLLVAGLFAGNALAASAVVITDEAGVKVTKEPAYSYTYDYGSGASVDTTNVNGALYLDFTAPTTTDGKSGAGYGFAWVQDSYTTLSAYKGVCLSYSAEAKFRIDFKQTTITDDDFYGVNVLAAPTPKKLFIAFADLKQQGYGKAVTWNVARQEAVQISYKDTYAKSSKLGSNQVVIHSFTLADECVTNAPNVTAGFKGYNGGEIELKEGDIHEMNMAEVFEDADGDDLAITVKIVSTTKSVVLVDSAAFNQNSVIKFATVSNPEGPATVTLTATDPTKKTATFSFTINTVDSENAPVAKDFEFEVAEDSSYKNGLTAKMNNLKSMGSDADGDAITLEMVDEPAHGTLTVNVSTGIFTYKPEANFNGEDSFTYRFFETDDPTSVSNIGTAHITVTPVNDVPKVTVVEKVFVDEAGEEHAFGDTITVDEDFAAFSVFIPVENITVEDPDGEEDVVYSAKVSGIVEVAYAASSDFHGIEISAIKDANGVAKVSFSAGDHKILVPTVLCYVKVEPVADAPIANNDVYTVTQGATFTADAKKGVLANDVNPDGDAKLTVVLDVDASAGTLELKEDGSFTYTSDADAAEEDAFAYHVVNEDGVESDMAIVTLNIVEAPKIAADVADTVGNRLSALTEDFAVAKKYTKLEVLSWFIDGDKPDASELTFTVRSDDSLLAPSIASGAITIKAVKDACGDAEVIVTATNKAGAGTDLKIPASITCVNDKPVALDADTIYINADSAFSVTLYLYDYVNDPDGDELVFTPNLNALTKVEAEIIEGDSIVISAINGRKYEIGQVLALGVKVADATTSTTIPFVIKLGAPTAIKPVIAAPKSNWQNAILANRGMAAIFDMQGRVMWKQKLPVSEAEVRAAASQVQGRKILRVNHQTFTIK